MEVEVTEPFSPKAGKRPINFIVMKYFLLGMLFSNGIESILIIPKTLSLMEANELQLEKLAVIYEEHDAFKHQLNEYSKLSKTAVEKQKESFDDLIEPKKNHHVKASNSHEKVVHKKPKITFEVNDEPMSGNVNDTIIEYAILIYGIITLAIGIIAVFQEHSKLLLLFIAIVAIGLVILFFSGLTLIVFMAILNDVIIALISWSFLQMLNAPVNDANYYPGAVTTATTAMYPGAAQATYNVDLSSQSSYLR